MMSLSASEPVPARRESTQAGDAASSHPSLTGPDHAVADMQHHMFLDRDHSILAFNERAVSYTHLTLPTIYSV